MTKIISQYKYLKISKVFFPLFIVITFLISIPSFSEIIYPEYTGDNVIDISGKFDNVYVSTLKSELNQSSNEVRIVFLDTKGKINLSFYAPKLFDKWNMPDDSVLAVIDPYLNKTGYGIGKKVLEEMRKRESVKAPDQEKEVSQTIDYDNLATAIFDKFSPDQMKQEKNSSSKPKKNAITSESGNQYSSSQKSTKKETNNSNIFNPLTIKILLAILFLIIVAGVIGYFYLKSKREKEQLELKTTYTFDADIQKQEVLELIDKINLDINKMSSYKGGTKKEVKNNIEKLELWKNKGEIFIQKMENQLEDIDIDDLGSIRELLDEGSLIKDELQKIHKESVSIRKDFKSTIKKTSMSISDIRVNLENCKVSLESIRTLYKLPLNISENKIIDCEKYIERITELASQNNPIEIRENSQKVYDIIKKIKKELEIIPHLYRQLQESIPISIDSTLEENIIDNHQRNKSKKEINDLKNDAIISLSNGDLDNSEALIKSIFDRLNDIRSLANKSK